MIRHPSPPLRRSLLAQACRLALPLVTAATSAQAAVVTLGDVPGVQAGTLFVGRTGVGSMTIDGGSTVQAERVSLGDQRTGVGTLTVQGTGSRLDLLNRLHDAVDIGGWGVGTLQVLAGGTVQHIPAAACALCNVILGNASGSTGQLTVSGAGSLFSTTRDVYVGSTNVQSGTDGNGNTWYWGTPGGTTQAEVRIDNGGRLDSRQLVVGFDQPDRPAQTGTEVSIGKVIVDGFNSVVSLVRSLTQTGDVALLQVGHSGNGSGTVDVRNGGRIALDGSSAPGNFAGINIGSGDGSSQGRLNIDGAGSRVHFSGGLGFVNVGSVANANGYLSVTGGGVLEGSDSSLLFMSVGRRGASGVAEVRGADAAGNASTIRLAGRNAVDGSGAFMHIGRNEGGVAGHGTMTIADGGQVLIDTRAFALSNPNGQAGFHVGVGTDATGRLDVSGRNAITGGASQVHVQAGTGFANWVAVGRDGGTGTVNITDGGRVVLESQRTSPANPMGYQSGDAQFFNIGRRFDSGTTATTGSVTVAGAGSELLMHGAADCVLFIGAGTNATGTLNLLDGGQASATGMILGNGVGGNGHLNLNGGRLNLSGTLNGGPAAGSGAGLAAGRNGGVATVTLRDNAHITITSSAPRSNFAIGGSGTGGNGRATVSLDNGSSVRVESPDADAVVGGYGNGTLGVGTLTLTRGSRFAVEGERGFVGIGAYDNTLGVARVDSTSTISASSLLGIGASATSFTGGSGMLIVNGTAIAPQLVIGAEGWLGGRGTVIADVVNRGTVAPGESPGRLTIDGGFDSRDGGRVLLEIEQQSDGSWLFDELVFTDVMNVLMDGALIEFDFQGHANPMDFLDSGLFSFGSFFKEGDGAGGVQAPSEELMARFAHASYSAHSDFYTLRNFTFTPTEGARFDIAQVPLPPSVALVLLGLAGLMLPSRKAAGRR